MDLPVIAGLVLGLYLLSRVSVPAFLSGIAFVLLGLLNVLVLADDLIGDLLHYAFRGLFGVFLLVGAYFLFRWSAATFSFIALLVVLHFAGQLTPVQGVFHRLIGLEQKPLAERVFCPEPLEAQGAQLYRVTNTSTGVSMLVRAGRSVMSRGPAICSATPYYLPLPGDRFVRNDANADNIGEYNTVTDYKVIVNYPSLRTTALTFLVSTAGGSARLTTGTLNQFGVTVQVVR